MKFWMSLMGGAAVLAAVVVIALVATGGDDDNNKSGARAGANTAANGAGSTADQLPPFDLGFPNTWRKVDAKQKKGDPPRLAIARKDGTGVVTMTIQGPVKQSLAALEAGFQEALQKRVPGGVTQLSAKRVKVPAGNALHTTWIQKKSGRIQSNLVVPAGKVSFSLDAVVAGNAKKAAREVGEIFSAFDAEPAR
jgi:hypothetical protein